jgi:hypothetical protein
MQLAAKWNAVAERYSNMSGLALLFVVVAPVCTWFAVRSDLAAIRAIGVRAVWLGVHDDPRTTQA